MPRVPQVEPPEPSGAEERLREFERARGIEPDPPRDEPGDEPSDEPLASGEDTAGEDEADAGGREDGHA